MMEITDIAGTAEIARAHDLVFAVDNTFMSPYFQRPLELGADVVVHSTTKFLNGHSDSIGGTLVAKRPEHGEWFNFVHQVGGGDLEPVRFVPGTARNQDAGGADGASRGERAGARRLPRPAP